MDKNQVNKAKIESVKPMLSLRRVAVFFDCYTADGKPATDTVLDWWHRGKIPPPDCRISRKAVYWKYETIMNFVNSGGYCGN